MFLYFFVVLSLLAQAAPVDAGRKDFHQPSEKRWGVGRSYRGNPQKVSSAFSSRRWRVSSLGMVRPSSANVVIGRSGDVFEDCFDLPEDLSRVASSCQRKFQSSLSISANVASSLVLLLLMQQVGAASLDPSPGQSGLANPLLPRVFRPDFRDASCAYVSQSRNRLEIFEAPNRITSYSSLIPKIAIEESGLVKGSFGERNISFPKLKEILEKKDYGFFADSEYICSHYCKVYLMGIDDESITKDQVLLRQTPAEVREDWIKRAVRVSVEPNLRSSVAFPTKADYGYIRLSKSFSVPKHAVEKKIYSDLIGEISVRLSDVEVVLREENPLMVTVQTDRDAMGRGPMTAFWLKHSNGYTWLETQQGKQLEALPEKAVAYLRSLTPFFRQTVLNPFSLLAEDGDATTVQESGFSRFDSPMSLGFIVGGSVLGAVVPGSTTLAVVKVVKKRERREQIRNVLSRTKIEKERGSRPPEEVV